MVDLVVRSVLVLGLMFGLLFAVASGVLYYAQAPLWLAAVCAVAVIGLQFLVSPWIIELMFRIRWLTPEELPPYLESFLRERANRHRLRMPRVGIIEDGNPNAFTFGHYPGNARIVITRGLLDMCEAEEVKAVVGHEFGHIVHWDFVIMTIAATVVLVLYYLYAFGRRAARGRGRNAGVAVLVAVGALVAYIIAEYLMLFLSRVREYYADRYGAEATRNPNALATALVKVAYGLARSGAAAGVSVPLGKHSNAPGLGGHAEEAPLSPLRGFRCMGIFDPGMGASLALAAAGAYSAHARAYDPAVMVKAMEWDLFNPWAWLCELGSSHPLPAKRIRALARYAQYLGQPPQFVFPDHAPESYWDEFFTDLLVYYLPVLGVLVGGAAGYGLAAGGLATEVVSAGVVGGALLGLGLGSLIRLRFMYPTAHFKDATVAELVGQVKVSAIRCVPARLRGAVIGRGIPGLYWSEDLVLEDDTGFMVLDYRQPLSILEFLFGLFRAEHFLGQPIEVVGWYRRFPRPFLEVWRIRTPDGLVNTCWVYWLKRVGSWLALLAGLMVLLASPLLGWVHLVG
jgi:Zn-dependent protease with chaperone function